ncbi:hypothetical protein K070079E91_38020 [Eisenbergiella porci]
MLAAQACLSACCRIFVMLKNINLAKKCIRPIAIGFKKVYDKREQLKKTEFAGKNAAA